MYSEPTIDPIYDSKYFIIKTRINFLYLLFKVKANNYASVYAEFEKASEHKYSNTNCGADIEDGPDEPEEPVSERMLADLDESREDMAASNIKSEESSNDLNYL